MLAFLEVVFWSSCLVFFYNYAGYAVLVYLFNKLQKTDHKAHGQISDFYPPVSFIVAAYNEADCIRQKLQNTLALEYPSPSLELIFITDGSTDATPAIISEFPAVRLLHRPERKGKSAALNRAAEEARNDVLIFSDANTLLNSDAIKNIVRHYQDPATGGVAGEKVVIPLSSGTDEVGAGEGLYW